MADFSHSVQKSQTSATLSKKISSNGNGFSSKTVYDDVFGGPPKFGVPTFSSRIDDYSEIFGSFNSSRVSSIPILDLPMVDERDVSFDVRSSKFDYSEIFGGFNGLDFAVPYEELLAEPKGGESSSDDVWTSAETGSPSAGSSEDPACSENNHVLANEESYDSLDGIKQFNMLYQKSNQISAEDGNSATTHIAQLDSVPAFTFVVDEILSSQQTEKDNTATPINKLYSLDVDSGDREMELKELTETMSDQPACHDLTQISECDAEHQKKHLKETILQQPVCHAVEDISESVSMHQSNHLKETISQQAVCPAVRQVSEGDSIHQRNNLKETNSHQAVCQAVGQTSESDTIHQRNHLKETISHQPVYHVVGHNPESGLEHQRKPIGTHPSKSFVTVSEINLRTLPCHVPPPSRPPPKLVIKQGDSKRFMASNIKASENSVLEKTVSDGSPQFFDVEVDASSSAAASAAAMKEAMDKAHARLKSAKESMERNKDGLQNRKKMGLKDEFKLKGRRKWETTHETHCLHEKPNDTFEGEDNEIKGFAVEERQKATRVVQVAPDVQVRGEKLVNASEKPVEQKLGEVSGLNQESCNRGEETGEWKVEEQYYELVQTDILRAAIEVPKHERVEDLILAQRVREYKTKTGKVALDHQEENDKKSETIKICVEEKDRKEMEVAEKARRWEEHEKNIKADQELHLREEYVKELSVGKDVSNQKENEQKFKVELEMEEHEKKLKESLELEECEKKLRQVLEQEEYEMKLKEVHEQEENEKKQKLLHEREEFEKREKMAREWEEHEKRLKEVREQVESEKRLKEAREREENEERRKESHECEEIEKRQKEAHEREENAKRLKEAQELKESDKRREDARDRERKEIEKRLKEEELEREENEKRSKEARERKENEKKLKEALEREENERRLVEACERKEHEKRLIEAREREEKEREVIEARNQEEKERIQQERKREDNEKKLKAAQEDLVHREDERNLKTSTGSLECVESDKKLKVAKEVCKLDEDKKLNATTVACKQEQDTNIFELAQMSREPMETAKCASEQKENGRELKSAKNILDEQDGGYSLNVKQMRQSAPELEKKDEVASEAKLQDTEKNLGEGQAAVLQENVERNKKVYQGALDQEENKAKYKGAIEKKQVVENGKKMDASHPTNSVDEKGPNTSQDTKSKGTILGGSLLAEEKEKEERMQREREREKERLRKVEEDREREREREKDRMSVERATREARERAFADARERSERAAVERATAEVRQRALAEARERLEKASAEAREKSLAEKASIEARIRAERDAVERATAEARERAAEKLRADTAAFGARERTERTFSEKYSSTSRDSGIKHSSSFSDIRDSQFQSSGCSNGFQRYPNSSNHAPYVSERFQGAEIESAQRCKARLERHQRTVERAAKALAEKNMRDLLAQREQAERNRFSETLDAEVKRWSNGKEGNLRALLSTLQYILGPDSGWQPIPLTEVITAIAVKKAYRKATLCVHPDKLQQRGASIQQKYICEKVFDLLKEAWNKFNSEER